MKKLFLIAVALCLLFSGVPASAGTLKWKVADSGTETEQPVTILFGRYEQDNDLSNGPEPIEWIVLAAEADARLVISKYGLIAMPYNSGDDGATWETCTLRSWLNGDFYSEAFNAREQERILESYVENADNEEFHIEGGNDTTDRVFLLSIDEMNQYLPVQEDRPTTPTDYAKAKGAYVNMANGNCWWWLRSPGKDRSYAAVVNDMGFSGGIYPNLGVKYRGEDVNTTDESVRPVMWMFPVEEDAYMPGNESEDVLKDEPTDEPAPEPVEDSVDLAREALEVLGDDTYRAVYDALLAGEVVQNGSKGDTAKGVQQTLVAFGQKISVDGSVGAKTIGALNAVQAAFGLEQTGALDAEGYAKLLPRLLITVNPDEANALLLGQMDSAEYDYMRACAYVAQGLYFHAKKTFEESQWGDWEERAAACAQPWPKTGVLYKNPDVKGSSSELTVKYNTDPDNAMLVKVYTTNGVLARTMFIGGTGKATVSLPAGTYIIKDGTGKNWYGEEDTFGYEGYYEIMTFEDGAQEVELKRNYSSTITVNVQGPDPVADSVGSDYEDWFGF